ncbi:MAG: tandem-95 repeat protein, partial [Magnetospirillum sp.]|nr:tandem-95 repeat protein [Magnetospirillum sp.]
MNKVNKPELPPQAGAHASGNGHVSAAIGASVVAGPGAITVTIPSTLLLSAEYVRDGHDLILIGPDGQRFIVRDYFATDNPPDLVTAGGAMIDAALATHLAGPLAPGQYAQAGAAAHRNGIGRVDTLTGTVEIRHADGTKVVVKKGDTVFQGDIVVTGDGGSIGITFADSSTFALGAKGRMVLDDMVYDPGAHHGSSMTTVIQGAFTFVSGQVAKTAPDAMKVKTPVMTIGIRGTAGGGSVEEDGNATAGLFGEKSGHGEIVLTTSTGTVTINIVNQAATVSVGGAIQTFTYTAQTVGQTMGDALRALPNAAAALPDSFRNAAEKAYQEHLDKINQTNQEDTVFVQAVATASDEITDDFLVAIGNIGKFIDDAKAKIVKALEPLLPITPINLEPIIAKIIEADQALAAARVDMLAKLATAQAASSQATAALETLVTLSSAQVTAVLTADDLADAAVLATISGYADGAEAEAAETAADAALAAAETASAAAQALAAKYPSLSDLAGQVAAAATAATAASGSVTSLKLGMATIAGNPGAISSSAKEAWIDGSATQAEDAAEAARIAAKTSADESMATNARIGAELEAARLAERQPLIDYEGGKALAQAYREASDTADTELSRAAAAAALWTEVTDDLATAVTAVTSALDASGAARIALLATAQNAAATAQAYADGGYAAALAAYILANPDAAADDAHPTAGEVATIVADDLLVASWSAAKTACDDALTRINTAVASPADDVVVESMGVLIQQHSDNSTQLETFYGDLQSLWQGAATAADAAAADAEDSAAALLALYTPLHDAVTALEEDAADALSDSLAALDTLASAQRAEAAAEWWESVAEAAATDYASDNLLAAVADAVAAADAATVDTDDAAASSATADANAQAGSYNVAAAQSAATTARSEAEEAADLAETAADALTEAATWLANADTWKVKTAGMQAAYDHAIKAAAAAQQAAVAADNHADAAEAALSYAQALQSGADSSALAAKQAAAAAAAAAADVQAKGAEQQRAGNEASRAASADKASEKSLADATQAAQLSGDATAIARAAEAEDAATLADGYATTAASLYTQSLSATTSAAARALADQAHTAAENAATQSALAQTKADQALSAAVTALKATAVAQSAIAVARAAAAAIQATTAGTGYTDAQTNLTAMDGETTEPGALTKYQDVQTAAGAARTASDAAASLLTQAQGASAAAATAADNINLLASPSTAQARSDAKEAAQAAAKAAANAEQAAGQAQRSAQQADTKADQAEVLESAANAKYDAVVQFVASKATAKAASDAAAAAAEASQAEAARARAEADTLAETQADSFADEAERQKEDAADAAHDAQVALDAGNLDAARTASAAAQVAADAARAAFNAAAKAASGHAAAKEELATAAAAMEAAQASKATAATYATAAADKEGTANDWRDGTATIDRIAAQAAYTKAAAAAAAAKTASEDASSAATTALTATADPLVASAAADAVRDAQSTARANALTDYETARDEWLADNGYSTAAPTAGQLALADADPVVAAWKSAYDAADSAYDNAVDAASKAADAATAAVATATARQSAADAAATAYTNALTTLADAAASVSSSQLAELLAESIAQKQVEQLMADALTTLVGTGEAYDDASAAVTAANLAATNAADAATVAHLSVSNAQTYYANAVTAQTSAATALAAATTAVANALVAKGYADSLPTVMSVDANSDGDFTNDSDDPLAAASAAALQAQVKANSDYSKALAVKDQITQLKAQVDSQVTAAAKSLASAQAQQAEIDAANANDLDAAHSAAAAAVGRALSAKTAAADASTQAASSRDLINGTTAGSETLDVRADLNSALGIAGTRLTALQTSLDGAIDKLLVSKGLVPADYGDNTAKLAALVAANVTTTSLVQAQTAIDTANTTLTNTAGSANTASTNATTAATTASGAAASAATEWGLAVADNAAAAAITDPAQAAAAKALAQSAATHAKNAAGFAETAGTEASTAALQVSTVAGLKSGLSTGVATANTAVVTAVDNATIVAARANSLADFTTASNAVDDGNAGTSTDAVALDAAASTAKGTLNDDYATLAALNTTYVTNVAADAAADREARAAIKAAYDEAVKAKARADAAYTEAHATLGAQADVTTDADLTDDKTIWAQRNLAEAQKTAAADATTAAVASQAEKTADAAAAEVLRLRTIIATDKATVDTEQGRVATLLAGAQAKAVIAAAAASAKGFADSASGYATTAQTQAKLAESYAATAKAKADLAVANVGNAALAAQYAGEASAAYDLALAARNAAADAYSKAGAGNDASDAATSAATAASGYAATTATGQWAATAQTAKETTYNWVQAAERALSSALAAKTSASSAAAEANANYVTALENAGSAASASAAATETAMGEVLAQKAIADAAVNTADTGVVAKANALITSIAGWIHTNVSTTFDDTAIAGATAPLKAQSLIDAIDAWKTAHPSATATQLTNINTLRAQVFSLKGTATNALTAYTAAADAHDTAASTNDVVGADAAADADVVTITTIISGRPDVDVDGHPDSATLQNVTDAKAAASDAAAQAVTAAKKAALAKSNAAIATQTLTDVSSLESAFTQFKAKAEQEAKQQALADAQSQLAGSTAVAVADSKTTAEDTATTIDVLANDHRQSGAAAALDAPQIVAISTPAHGTAVLSADGTKVLYTPTANYSGADSFTYTVSNTDTITDPLDSSKTITKVTTSQATVSLTVTAVNDAPVAGADVGTAASSSSAVTVKVLSNDTDVDGDTLSVVANSVVHVGSGAAKGLVAIQTDGSVKYQPTTSAWASLDDGETGSDTFTYTVSDGHGGTATGNLTFTVTGTNDAPTVTNLARSMDEDTVLTFTRADFTAKFSDVDTSDALTKIRITTVPANGTLKIDGVAITAANLATAVKEVTVADLDAGKLTFTPTANWYGSTSFGWKGFDGTAWSDTAALVGISVANVVDSPSVAAVSATGTEDGAIGFAATDFSAKFTQPEGTALVGIRIDSLPETGTLTLSGSAVTAGQQIALAQIAGLKFTPTANWNGSTAFTWSGYDGTSFSATPAAVNLTVTAVNDAPSLTANATLAAVAEDATPAGATITALFSGAVDDQIDTGSLAGVAVIANAANAGTEGKWQYSTNGGTTWADIGSVGDTAATPALALSAATSLRFLPVANYNGTPTGLSVRGIDNSYSGSWSDSATGGRVPISTVSTGGTTAIAATARSIGTTVTAGNDAPTLTAANVGSFAAVAEDVASAANPGTLVSTLRGTAIADIDSGALKGIAVTSAPTTNGTWEYKLAADSAWSTVPAVSATNVLLLADDARLRFVPAENYSGSVALGFVAWDRTSGVEGTAVNPGAGGDGLAFSALASPASVTITVTGVADTPTIATAVAATAVATPVALVITPTAGDASEVLSVTITGLPTGAVLSAGTNNGGGSWTLTAAQLSGLTFTPPAGSETDYLLGVTLTSTDGSSTATATATLSVTVGSNFTQTVTADYDGSGNAASQNITAGDAGYAITTGAADDDVTTGSGADVITAGAGADVVESGSGNDTLFGGAGNDSLTASAGDDTV